MISNVVSESICLNASSAFLDPRLLVLDLAALVFLFFSLLTFALRGLITVRWIVIFFLLGIISRREIIFIALGTFLLVSQSLQLYCYYCAFAKKMTVGSSVAGISTWQRTIRDRTYIAESVWA